MRSTGRRTTLPKLDALGQYQDCPLFSQKERAALDFATDLTEHKHVSPDTFIELSRHYSGREICEIVWLVSSNHRFNINNLGLGIESDGLCEVNSKAQHAVVRTSSSPGGAYAAPRREEFE
ncbi:MAG: hypothetical protein JOY80_02325 [Candidatus Dormibacteraeota bacterium]|nr:hypothetical protein [Candidatus Dormibacteraeota bacterium]